MAVVWRGMTQEELDKAYDQAAYAPNMQVVIARFASSSERVRQRIVSPARFAYGPGENEGLDVYSPSSWKQRSAAGMDKDTSQTRLSSRVQAVRPSPTLNMAAMTRKLKEQGREVIILSMGEPDFDTEEFIKEAGISAIRRNGFISRADVADFLAKQSLSPTYISKTPVLIGKCGLPNL